MSEDLCHCHFDERSEEKSAPRQAKDFSLSLEMTDRKKTAGLFISFQAFSKTAFNCDVAFDDTFCFTFEYPHKARSSRSLHLRSLPKAESVDEFEPPPTFGHLKRSNPVDPQIRRQDFC